MIMANEALGMIETYGYIGAIEAADVSVKSANVKLLGLEFVKGGLVTIYITGDVGAVKASINAATSAVKKIGSLISSHVIARPGQGIEKILPKPDGPDYDPDNNNNNNDNDKNEESNDNPNEGIRQEEVEEEVQEKKDGNNQESESTLNQNTKSEEELKKKRQLN